MEGSLQKGSEGAVKKTLGMFEKAIGILLFYIKLKLHDYIYVCLCMYIHTYTQIHNTHTQNEFMPLGMTKLPQGP